ncbi:hypothetical protein TNCV_1623831 [Trichonephila clavipes]|nr:hypothetical protein TNCV_1623831 [Trichonephila clavipes]
MENRDTHRRVPHNGFPHVNMQHIVAHSRNMDFLSPSIKWTLYGFQIYLWSSQKPNESGNSDDISAICGNRTISPLNFTVKLFASSSFSVIVLMTKRVPLHNLGGFKLCSRIPVNQSSTENCVVAFLIYPENSKTMLETYGYVFINNSVN